MNPYRLVSDALKQMLTCAQLPHLVEPLNQFQQLENSADSSQFGQLVAKMAVLTTVHCPEQLADLLVHLTQVMRRFLSCFRPTDDRLTSPCQ